MNTTPGKWIVVPVTDTCADGTFLHKVMAEDELIALVPNLADAVLLAVSKEMLETLIAIHETLTTSKQVIDLVKLGELINSVFEKMAAESGEM